MGTFHPGTMVSAEEWDEIGDGGEGAGGGESGMGRREGVGEGGGGTIGGRSGVGVLEMTYRGSLSTSSTQYTLFMILPS